MTTVNTNIITDGKPSTPMATLKTVAFQPHSVAIQPHPVVKSTSYGLPTERTYTMTQTNLHTSAQSQAQSYHSAMTLLGNALDEQSIAYGDTDFFPQYAHAYRLVQHAMDYLFRQYHSQ